MIMLCFLQSLDLLGFLMKRYVFVGMILLYNIIFLLLFHSLQLQFLFGGRSGS
jgi:hypothetical protein